MGETCQALLKELWKDLIVNLCVWEHYWRLWKGWKCLLKCSTTVDPTERKISCSTRSPSKNYPGAWRAHAWKAGLHEDFSLPSLQTPLPRVSTYSHAGPFLYCLCVHGMQAHGMCMEYAIYVTCHICGIFKSLHPYHIHSLTLFFPTCSDGSVFEKWIISAASFSLNSNTDAWQWEGSFYLKK